MARIERKAVQPITHMDNSQKKEVVWGAPKLPDHQGKENPDAKNAHPLDPKLVFIASQIMRRIHEEEK